MQRLSLLGLVSVLLVLPVAAAGGAPYTTGSVTQVSGDSPFDGDCGLEPTGGGEVFVGSEVEPWVDVSPADADVRAGMWQQDRWSNGGGRGNVLAVTFDGGDSWDTVVPPDVTECSGGAFDRASDPWVSFAADGDLYLMHLVLDVEPPEDKPGGIAGRNGMMVQKVPAAALTDDDLAPEEIEAPQLIAEDTDGNLHDKNTLTADPVDENAAYAVWDFLDLPEGTKINPDRASSLGFKGAALFSRTTDGGQTWSEPEVLYDPGANNQTLGNQIVVAPDGRLLDFFNEILNFRNDDGDERFEFNLAFKHSADQGETWRPAGRPVRFAKIQRAPVVDPDTEEPHRTADLVFDVAVDRTGGDSDGALYAVWQDARFTGRSAIALATSTDGGQTWSEPVRINQTPEALDGTLNGQAFTPQVRVAADGTVGVSYYDFRTNTEGGGTDTDLWLAHCHAGGEDCADPASWTDEAHVAGPFDSRQAPVARGFFLGDYVGLGRAGDGFAPFFVQTTPSDPGNIYDVTVTPSS